MVLGTRVLIKRDNYVLHINLYKKIDLLCGLDASARHAGASLGLRTALEALGAKQVE